MAENKYCLL